MGIEDMGIEDMGIDGMNELNSGAESVAEGGKVWIPPTSATAKAGGGRTAKRGVVNFVLRNPLLVVLVCFTPLATLLVMSAFSVQGTLGAINSKEEAVVNAVKQEYGYKEVSFSITGDKADVTTETNVVETVDVLTYKGATILFANRKQLEEKITEVENGSYPEELYW